MTDTIINNLHIWTTAQTIKSNGRTISVENQRQYGIDKLRELILELAVRGMLVAQDPKDEHASELLKKIANENQRLVKNGQIKKQEKQLEIEDSEKPFELPNGWIWVRLGTFSEIKGGKRLPQGHSFSTDITPYIYIQVTNMKEGSITPENLKYITKETFAEISRYIISKDDLYITIAGTIGDVGIVPEQFDGMNLTENAAKIVFSIVDKQWLQKTLTSKLLQQQFLDKTNQLAQPKLALHRVGSSCIPLPPLAEQHRIVAKVDELMAFCDQLEQMQTNNNSAHQALVEALLGTLTQSASPTEFETSWHRIAAHFDTLFTTEYSIDYLKQTILQLAVMGKLVPQNADDEPASELLKKIAMEKERLVKEGKIKKQEPLPEIREDEKLFELPKGWEWRRLNEIIDVRDGTHDTPQEATGEKTFPLVTSKNFENGKINFDEAKRISEKDHLEISKRSHVERYDILFSMIGGNLGNQVIVNDNRSFSIKNVALFKYYKREYTSPFYIKKIMEHIALDLQSRAIGGAQPFVSLGYLRNIVIALPPINEQHRIVSKVNELFALCDALKDRIKEAQGTQVQLAEAMVEGALG